MNSKEQDGLEKSKSTFLAKNTLSLKVALTAITAALYILSLIHI